MTTQPLNGYDRVRRARQAGRSGIDRFIAALFDEFTELKGDRLSPSSFSKKSVINVWRL